MLEGFKHTYIHAWTSQTYIHSWGSMLEQAPGRSKNQVSSRLSRMLQNAYKNQGLDILFGPGRISEFWASEASDDEEHSHVVEYVCTFSALLC